MRFLGHEYEGSFKKVLCVCSGGILRSPTTAWVLSQKPYEYNTRAVGTEREALIPLSHYLAHWADVILCMQDHHWEKMLTRYGPFRKEQKFYVLDVPDNYEYRDPELVKLIQKKVSGIFSV